MSKVWIVFLTILLGNAPCFSSVPLVQNQQAITNPLRTDGFGSQFQTIIYSVIYAELNNKNYLYTPFFSLEHNYDMNPEFLAKKEWLINFIGNFPLNRDAQLQSSISPRHYINYFEQNLVACCNSQSLKKIRQLFRSNKNRAAFFAQDYFHIAVHIRRPNTHDSREEGTNTPDAIYLRIIENLRVIYGASRPLFHIYSQGNIEKFQNVFTGNDIVFHLNETVEDTFSALVLADVLVTSRSSLSYTAGILSEGVIYYIPFWHPPLPGWIPI